MLSLSNYLTNRSETALISAYCSALLNAASLGGLSGKPWYGDQQARQADKGEQQHCSQISEPREMHTSVRAASLETLSISYGSLKCFSAPLLNVSRRDYGIASSQPLNNKEQHHIFQVCCWSLLSFFLGAKFGLLTWELRPLNTWAGTSFL